LFQQFPSFNPPDRVRGPFKPPETEPFEIYAARKPVSKADANLILTFSTNAKPLLPLRYFFCANSLAASVAREKSKIDPAATYPFKLAVDRGVR
jgi:hypothetical protein